jgi:soluble P-type ATPase
MITVQIPGFRELRLEHLVLDYNGTLAVDGILLPKVSDTLKEVSGLLQVHVITADTFGKVRQQLEGLPLTIAILPSEQMEQSKLEYCRKLGLDRTAAIGNGRNDREMVKHAALGISVIQAEGAASATMANSHIITTNIVNALQLLLHPLRLTATLRS